AAPPGARVAPSPPPHAGPPAAPTPPWLPWGRPRAVARSARLSAAARTFTSTSLGFGRGCGMSRSASPFSVATAAFISFSVGCFLERRGGRKRGLLCRARGLRRVRRPPVGSILRPQSPSRAGRRRSPHESTTARAIVRQDAVRWAAALETLPMERTKPPFRAEHVGSLIRPGALIEAREKAEKKEISDAELKRVQHAAIREVVRLQEELGLKLVTDGEYNRHSWHRDFMLKFSNVRMIPSKLT